MPKTDTRLRNSSILFFIKKLYHKSIRTIYFNNSPQEYKEAEADGLSGKHNITLDRNPKPAYRHLTASQK